MKSRTVIWAAGLACVAALAIGQLSPAVVGKWQGDKHGSPWVTLNVTREKNGGLSGTAVFFILDRSEDQAPPKVLGKQEVQLIDPKLEGNTVSFKVRNQQGQVTMNPSSGETLAFHMTLNSDSEGLLKSDDPGNAGGEDGETKMRFNRNAAMKGEERMSQFSILGRSRRPSLSIVFVVLSIVLFAVPICVGQTMQQGISVNLPVSSKAVSIRDADREDSLMEQSTMLRILRGESPRAANCL